MAISILGGPYPIPYPVEGNETFWENFLATFDGSPTTIVGGTPAAAATANAAKIFAVYGMGALAGTTFSLPAATGTGVRLMFYTSTLATSNSHIIKTSPSTDVFQGIIAGFNNSTGATVSFAGASNSNTITLNRTATGSVTIGEHVEVFDVSAGIWLVRGLLSASGTAFTTPFSHV